MARQTKPRLPRDPYWDVVQSLMQDILTVYALYREKKPVMLFDMPSAYDKLWRLNTGWGIPSVR